MLIFRGVSDGSRPPTAELRISPGSTARGSFRKSMASMVRSNSKLPGFVKKFGWCGEGGNAMDSYYLLYFDVFCMGVRCLSYIWSSPKLYDLFLPSEFFFIIYCESKGLGVRNLLPSPCC